MVYKENDNWVQEEQKTTVGTKIPSYKEKQLTILIGNKVPLKSQVINFTDINSFILQSNSLHK